MKREDWKRRQADGIARAKDDGIYTGRRKGSINKATRFRRLWSVVATEVDRQVANNYENNRDRLEMLETARIEFCHSHGIDGATFDRYINPPKQTRRRRTVSENERIVARTPEIGPLLESGRLTVTQAKRLARLGTEIRNTILAALRSNEQGSAKRIIRRALYQRPEAETPTDPNIAIWCGDCIALMRERVADASVSVVTTSPPYNRKTNYGAYSDDLSEAEYYDWMREVFAEIKRVLTPEGSFFLVAGHSPKHQFAAMDLAALGAETLVLQNQIIWVKSIHVDGHSRGHFSPMQGRRFVNRAWEFVFHFTKSGDVPLDRLAVGVPYEAKSNRIRSGFEKRCAGDVWFVPHSTVHGSEERADHPATFPPELGERCIRLAGIHPETMVLDPFCGVHGMVAAARLGVNGIGIDLDSAYCRAARERIGAVN